MTEQTKDPAPPDPRRWWDRKWKICLFGGAVGVISLLIGFTAAYWGGKGLSEAVEPFVRMGAYFGFGLMLLFIAPATAENITDKIWGRK